MSTPETQEVRAAAKWVRITPRKARLVVEHIRGRTVPEARTVLAFTERAAAREIDKLLRSAVANAEANHNLIGDDLVVKAAYVDEGPTIKRWRARARGRAAQIRKRTCHITLTLVPADDGYSDESAEPRRRRPRRSRSERSAKKAAPKAKPAARDQGRGEAEGGGQAQGEAKAESEAARCAKPKTTTARKKKTEEKDS